MNLLLDVGNSYLKWCSYEGLRKGEIFREAYGADIGVWLDRCWQNIEQPASVWISSVAGEKVDTEVSRWVRRNWLIESEFVVSRRAQAGVVNGYRQPEQLGVDRWMALLAGRAISHQPCLIVDCGTATTIDAIDAEGRHLGGLIIPGLEMMKESLLGGTAILELEDAESIDFVATDTASAILSGGINATKSLINEMRDRLSKKLDQPVLSLLTGGAAGQLLDGVLLPKRHEPNLVLNGVAIVAGLRDNA
ncbi:MAG: type III pantothenate kinase [endosymbiont of Escarpia spicata]|uniref:Type III pantothenate kinase n=1 Tax=endosymbiont of Escarpia spicata TaxID=2200908 RepID=A0A370DMN2_9GAMM|nr:MAG: type III pantothenate kinase [endosymbiont of Escarpia spicata]